MSSVRSHLLSLRCLFFFAYGSLGVLFPFLPLFLAERGLDSVRISWVMVLIPAANLLVPPIWGTVADVLRARLWLLRLACVGSGATIWMLLPSSSLWTCVIAVGVFAFFRMPLSSLADATAYRVLGGERVDYSTVRVWGSIGFASFVLLPGLLPDSMREVAVVAAASVLLLLAAASTSSMRAPPRRREPGVVAQVIGFARRPGVLLVLIGSAVHYTGHSMYDAYYSLHLARLGRGEGFVGIAWAVGVAVEILVMLMAPRFIHLVSSGWLLAVCTAVAAGRWLLMSWATSLWALLMIQPLQSISFGLWFLGLVKHIQERAPDRLRTSLQSLAQASIGSGMVLGYLLGGRLLDEHGGAVLYQTAAGAAAVAFGLYVAACLVERTSAGRECASERPLR
jgi:predicted MFS family arabinose efflux permease